MKSTCSRCSVASKAEEDLPSFPPILPSTRKKPRHKPVVEKEAREDESDLCACCVFYIFIHGHLNSSCIKKDNKSCTNCAQGKKTCSAIQTEFTVDKTRLLTMFSHYISMDNDFVRGTFKLGMKKLTIKLAQKIEKAREPTLPIKSTFPLATATPAVSFPLGEEILRALNTLINLEKKKKVVMDHNFLLLTVSFVIESFCMEQIEVNPTAENERDH